MMRRERVWLMYTSFKVQCLETVCQIRHAPACRDVVVTCRFICVFEGSLLLLIALGVFSVSTSPRV